MISDHKPLVYIFSEKKGIPVFSANRLQRWCFISSNYNFDIKFVQSEFNIADFLSRTELTSQSKVESSKLDSLGYVHYVHESCPFVVNWRKVKLETGVDPILSKVVDAVIRGNTLPKSPEFKPFTNRFCELTIDHDCLMWGYRVIVPHKLRASVLKELHVNHFGINKMKALARSYFWWPNLGSQIEELAKNCNICSKFRNVPQKSVLKPWPWPKKAWTRIHVDFLGPICNNIYCFVVMDAHSKWIENFLVYVPVLKLIITNCQKYLHGLACLGF